MNDSSKSKSLAETFAENDRKAHRFTVISLCIFIVLFLSNFYFAVKWRGAVEEKDQFIVRRDSMYEAVKQTLKNTETTVSVNEKRYESVISLNPNLEKFLQSDSTNKEITLYLQYIDSYLGTADSLMNELRSAGYRPLGKEKMRRANFSSTVKYFNNNDKVKAENIAKFINSTITRYKQVPIRVRPQDISAPAGLIEIWLGEVTKPDVQQIIDNETKALDK